MVEEIAGVSERIARLEAARLRLIRELHGCEEMCPLRPSPAGLAAQGFAQVNGYEATRWLSGDVVCGQHRSRAEVGEVRPGMVG